ncbi:EF-hand domain-containing protein [Piscinibacter terrae]|uniref:EF-hand domain-containing protein n=1 Tax=Piscinibacter terrae TaxID=2496871 RepID=A0A3N7IUJ1_9BURK|nr:EF-hand domain-containing protein [Albitalea terrae]RQP22502.1 EF-hand domain-containing protein [Albitalea terrae]
MNKHWIGLLALPFVATNVLAGDGKAEVPMRDPWVPPAVRAAAAASASAAETRGAALHAQVEQKLRASFDAADTQRTGSITREQAKAAGLGMIAGQFDQIDTGRTGRVSFEDVKRFLKKRGASTL